MRKILIAIAVIVVVVIAGAAIFVATFDVNRYRGTIQAQLQQHLGSPVQLGDMHLKLFPPSITVQNLAIADDPRFSSDAPFVKASELDVAVKLFPLLHKDIQIESLNLEQPTVNLIKNQGGPVELRIHRQRHTNLIRRKRSAIAAAVLPRRPGHQRRRDLSSRPDSEQHTRALQPH